VLSIPSRGHDRVREGVRALFYVRGGRHGVLNVSYRRVLASSLGLGTPEARHPRTLLTDPLNPLTTVEIRHPVSVSWVYEWREVSPSANLPPIVYASPGDRLYDPSVILPSAS
jgi:hypothetical protein